MNTSLLHARMLYSHTVYWQTDFFSLALTHAVIARRFQRLGAVLRRRAVTSMLERLQLAEASADAAAVSATAGCCEMTHVPAVRTATERLAVRRPKYSSLRRRNMSTFFAGPPGQAQVLTMLLMLPLLAAAATVPATSTNVTRPKFDSCYGCICEAASQCNPRVGCSKGVCGLFQITKPYWMDAGSPTVPGTPPDAPDAFERCTTNTFCALETTQLYMARYGKDCNGDGDVGCYDFAMIHYLGPGCEGKVGQEYIEEFENCRFNLLLLNQP